MKKFVAYIIIGIGASVVVAGPGCAFHYKTVQVDIDTPAGVNINDIRNENLSEGINASPRVQGAENVNAKVK